MAERSNFRFYVALILLWGVIAEAAPRPDPVEVFGGYSSVSKSVTFTKRMEFQMNKDQSLKVPNNEVQSAINVIKTNVTTKDTKKTPQVNHSVQFSIGTDIKSDEEKMDPPLVMESIANDIHEMKKMATNGIKIAEAIPSSTFSPSIVSGNSTERVELLHSLEGYDDALYEDVAPEDAGSLGNKSEIPVLKISAAEFSHVQDSKTDTDNQSHSSVTSAIEEKETIPESSVKLTTNLENEFVTKLPPGEITHKNMTKEALQNTESYDEFNFGQDGEIVKINDSFIEFPPPVTPEETNLTEVLDNRKLPTTQPPIFPETEALPTIEDDVQIKGRRIQTKNIGYQLLHRNEFKQEKNDTDVKDGNEQSINLKHTLSKDQTLSNLKLETATEHQHQEDRLENLSGTSSVDTDDYDDLVELDHSTVSSIGVDTEYDFETTISELGVTESVLSEDVVGEVNTELQTETFPVSDEPTKSSTMNDQFETQQTIISEMKTTTAMSMNNVDSDLEVTTFSTPTQPAELPGNIDSEVLITTPFSSRATPHEDEEMEFLHPIGVFVNDSGLAHSALHDQPPTGALSTPGEVVETQRESDFNYASYYPTDYEYIDFDETTDTATTVADMLSYYEYTDHEEMTDLPITPNEFLTDEITPTTRFETDGTDKLKFSTSTIPTDSLKTEGPILTETQSSFDTQKAELLNSSTEKTLKEIEANNLGQNQGVNDDHVNFQNSEFTGLDSLTENDSPSTSAPTSNREPVYSTNLPIGTSIEIGDLESDYNLESAHPAPDSTQPKNLETNNEHHAQMVATHQPSIDIPALISNIDFSKIDFSALDLSGLEDPSALPAGKNGENVTPPNLESLDLTALISDLGLGNVDLSQIPPDFAVGNLDISRINLEDIPTFELGSTSDLFQLPNSSQNNAVRSHPNLENLYSRLTFGETIAPHAHPLRKFNSANPGTRIPDLFEDPVDPSRVNLNIDQMPKLPVGFRHPHVPNEQRVHSSHLPRHSASPYFRLHDTGDQFLVVEDVGGRNFEPPSEVNRPRSVEVIDPNIPVELFHLSNAPSVHSKINPLPDKNFSDDVEYDTRLRYPEPNTVNFFHPLHMVDPNSFHGSGNDNNQEVYREKNIDDLYEDYIEQGSFGAKILAKNQTANTTNDLNLTNLTHLLEGPKLSGFDLSQIPADLDLSGIDLSSIPSNLSIEGLDIEKIVSSIDLSKLDLSKINFAELNIPNILEQLSGSSIDLTLFGQPSFSSDVEKFFHNEAAINSKRNAELKSHSAVGPVAVASVEKSKWVTENETDQKVLDELGISHFLAMANSISLDGGASSNFLLCTMCKTGVVTGRKLMTDLAKSDREILSLVVYMCIEFKLFPKDVCRGMINSVGYEVLHVLRTTQHNPEIFCSMMLADACEQTPLPDWKVDTPERATLRAEPSVYPSHGDFLILHISDLHTDPEYAAGTDAECDYPLCCRDWDAREGRGYRRDEEAPKKPMESFAASVMANADDPNTDLTTKPASISKFPKHAGRWGAFGHCDLPLRSLDRILQAGADLQPDLVYITGDLPPHDVWMQTKESVQEINGLTAERIRLAFPDTPLVMTVGNHETEPINSFPVPEVYDQGFNPSWLYESLATQWKQWVPSSSVPTLIKGGYYAVTPYPGLRVLSVNGNYCNSMNWWLMIAHKDPTEQLVWIDQQLAEANAAGEKVHILTHIPPGYHECLPSWSREFARIVTKYADVVTGIFSGHQHLDQWEVIYDPEDSTRPTSVVYVAPSATTFREHSPSFRTFTVDGGKGNESSWTVVDHHTYTANLTIANLPDNILEFERRYSAREEFNMTDLSPQSWSDVVDVMARDQTMFNKHMRFKHNYWAEPTEVNDCDKECKTKSLCFLVTGDSSNKEPCERLQKIIA